MEPPHVLIGAAGSWNAQRAIEQDVDRARHAASVLLPWGLQQWLCPFLVEEPKMSDCTPSSENNSVEVFFPSIFNCRSIGDW